MHRPGRGEAWEDARSMFYCELLASYLAHHSAEVRGESEVAPFVELVLAEPGPLAVDVAAANRTAEHEHDVGVSVVGAAVSVLAGSSSELAHGDDDGIFREIAKVIPEGRDRF